MQKLVAVVALLLSVPVAASTTVPGGVVANQTWTAAGSPYVVQGDVTVPAGSFLTIDAGTVVEFAPTDAQASGLDAARVEMTILGLLTATGSTTQPVTFQAQTAPGNSPAAWYGIIIDRLAQPATITNFVLTDTRIGVTDGAGSAITFGSISSFSEVGIAATTTTRTPFLQFLSLSGAGGTTRISASGNGTANIDAVTVAGGSTGILVDFGGSATITNAVVYGVGASNAFDGQGIGVRVTSGVHTVIANCSIDHNKYGIAAVNNYTGQGTVTILNSVITNSPGFGIAAFGQGVNDLTRPRLSYQFLC